MYEVDFQQQTKYHYLIVNALLEEYALFVMSKSTKIAAAWVDINIQTVNALPQVTAPDCKA